ncbi:Polynucleotidyl transferase ribonuclease H-like superfamily protein [Euphorbia peplus]|nr:Polynucleotidyl transferase ribonuclease H-like superfamily protein [Euphorbia peplus]
MALVCNIPPRLRRQQEVLAKAVKSIHWEPPRNYQVKINTDGAYKSSIGAASAGGLIRDTKGNWCGGFSIYLGSATAFEAELVGILRGLDLAWHMGFRNIILESDCKNAVDLFRHRDSNSGLARSITNCVDGLVRSIKEYLDKEWNWEIQHQYREGNEAADWLANQGIQLSQYGFWVYPSQPLGISYYIEKDRLGIPTDRLCKV